MLVRFTPVGGIEGIDLDLVIEVTDVGNDGLVFHSLDMLELDHIDVAGSGNINVARSPTYPQGWLLRTLPWRPGER